ncbi:type B 50S ribosomal protein L31 [Nocardia sp. CDC159]|uniref:Large ribosomal subunit protein bL31B n=1 Tax=Nocardia pulmonis TaxID=2951408 RepID=A0A9X2E8U9_9NOCA|nr:MULTISPECIES: type B 50S ribosomal protein L31 [Nocardia]MCM6775158.1 type B 50S ribosomal protein L31 [Nocardia pulmonis]MCM6789628.1 type B 50S ribosomal protein L31 [Nocardia sp. CDC159]
MQSGIHPDYHPVVFEDASTGKRFLTRSTATGTRTVEWSDGNTYPLITVDVTADSHPFWTGANRVLDTQGRVERFERKYGKRVRAQADPAARKES